MVTKYTKEDTSLLCVGDCSIAIKIPLKHPYRVRCQDRIGLLIGQP